MEHSGKPIEYLSINESNALLKSVDDTRDHAIITLFLTTGIFLNEMEELTTDSINWEKRLLTIKGHRNRQLALNEQACVALSKWSRERIDTPCQQFFTTTKGKVKGLSARSIDHLIRKAALSAGLGNQVNAHILRNTFAVRLFSQDIPLSEASEILGITDHQSLTRYVQAAEHPPIQSISEKMNAVDTRPLLTKVKDKLFSVKPKQVDRTNKLKGHISAEPEECTIGRDHIIREIEASLNKGQSVLLTGQLGIGKTHLLKAIAGKQEDVLFISSPIPTKAMLTRICDKLELDWKSALKSRASTRELIDYLEKVKPAQSLKLVIDNLGATKISDLEPMMFLLENFTVLGATEETIPRVKQLWWKFRQIELNPLSEESAKELLKYLTQNLSISDYELLETRVLTLSNNLPLAIVDMAKRLSYYPAVTRKAVRELYHEAGVIYRDWTVAIVILWAGVTMMRFVALGTHSFEGYILAGMGMSVLMVFRYFMYKMR